MAEREGFEPSDRKIAGNTLAGCRIRPTLPPLHIKFMKNLDKKNEEILISYRCKRSLGRKILLFLYTLKYIENLAPCSHMRHTINAYGSVFAVLYGCGSGSRTPVLPVYETGVIYISISLNRNGTPNGIRTRDSGLKGRRLRPLVDGSINYSAYYHLYHLQSNKCMPYLNDSFLL